MWERIRTLLKMNIFHLGANSGKALNRIHICTRMSNEVSGNETLMRMCTEVLGTAFTCAANIRWTAKHYLFGVGTSKKNMFAMLGICLTRPMPNKPLFGICSGLPQSCMPRSRSHIDVDIPLETTGRRSDATVDDFIFLIFQLQLVEMKNYHSKFLLKNSSYSPQHLPPK